MNGKYDNIFVMKHINIRNLNIVFTEKSDGNMRDAILRKNFIKKHKLPFPVLPKQIHSSLVLNTDSHSLECDGLFTQEQNKALGVLTADCMPVVLTDFSSLSVIHAGWRGLIGGIIENALRMFGKKEIFAFIGPSARKCCYEVQEGFAENLKKTGVSERFFSRFSDRITFSLQELAEEKLKICGIKEIYDISLCTICSQNFFSYRNGNFEERILTMAWLED